MSTQTEVQLGFDPSESRVLGVVGDYVHILGWNIEKEPPESDCILLITIEEYKACWDKWLEGKKGYCERWNEYCGVMGTMYAKEHVPQDSITINVWNEAKEDMESKTLETYIASDFDGPDFEHG